MYVNQEYTEHHHLTIEEIKDYTYKDKPYLILQCNGKVMKRDTSLPKGHKIIPYRISVAVFKSLIDYVFAELSNGDDIFVIGYTVLAHPNKYTTQRNLIANCIYREDWMNYFKGNNPQDLEV